MPCLWEEGRVGRPLPAPLGILLPTIGVSAPYGVRPLLMSRSLPKAPCPWTLSPAAGDPQGLPAAVPSAAELL